MSTEERVTTGLEQELISEVEGERLITDGMPELARKSAAEGCVLLKNNGVLPFKKKEKITVFGRCQVDTFYVGYGSGGDVHPPYQVSILDGLRACCDISVNEEVAAIYEEWCHREENIADPGKEWGKWPYSYPEMPVEKSLIQNAAKKTETAVIILGRAAGEERENYLGEGSYYLTQEEKKLIAGVTDAFEKTVVVLNCGNIIDFSWTKEYKTDALLLMWLGGMETGNALADVLSGRENPSGKLTDTIAVDYESYPSAKNFNGSEFNNYEEDIYVGYRYFETFAKDKVLYSFGYGLSYTTFDTVPLSYYGQGADDAYLQIVVRVTNTGKRSGKEVVQLYVEAPQGKLGREKRSLIAFQKTEELAPGTSQDICFQVPFEQLSAFDDCGKTGCVNSYVLEKGEYWYYCGVSGKNGKLIFRNAGGSDVTRQRVFKTLPEICPLQEDFKRIVPVMQDGKLVPQKEVLTKSGLDMRKRILEQLPAEVPVTGDRGIHFSRVQKKEVSLEEFIAQLSDEELEGLSRGEGGMSRPLGVGGNTGIYGGVLPSLREKGVPAIVTADGPAGLRIKRYTSLLPCGTALACTWNTGLVEQLFECIAKELKRFDVDVLLSPGLNIHRNPLCGRNFEYFSEDPYVSGKMAVAAVRGIQSQGASACAKHFACNNQEVNRHKNDSRVSGRALREIYLRGFEICVKEAHPKNIMTSYNKVNGVWSHYNFDLAETVLRQEWKYDGVIMTDWWMQYATSPEFPNIRDNAYRVRARVNVLMPGSAFGGPDGDQEYISDGTLLETLGNTDGITRGELQKNAWYVLDFATGIDRK